MGSFKRALLGYSRGEVDAAISAHEARIDALRRDVEDSDAMARIAGEAAERAEGELASLSGMVIEREREIRGLAERLREADERHQRSIASLESVSARLGEIEEQARGQATRIRMKALREAVEVDRRARELSEAQAAPAGDDREEPSPNGAAPDGLFEGPLKLEVGPLGDFSQLVGLEDAIGRLGASAISVERFSEGRATLSLNLDEPVELLRELEEASPFEFRVRRNAGDNLVLDVDEDQGPEQRAA